MKWLLWMLAQTILNLTPCRHLLSRWERGTNLGRICSESSRAPYCTPTFAGFGFGLDKGPRQRLNDHTVQTLASPHSRCDWVWLPGTQKYWIGSFFFESSLLSCFLYEGVIWSCLEYTGLLSPRQAYNIYNPPPPPAILENKARSLPTQGPFDLSPRLQFT